MKVFIIIVGITVLLASITVIWVWGIPAMREANYQREEREERNESSAVASIRTLNTAQITYNATYQRYADTLPKLGGTNCKQPTAAAACFIDTQLAKGTRNGYKFTVLGSASAYQVFANPEGKGRYFCSFEDAIVRSSSVAITVCNDTVSPLE